ncbi:MAG: hypothetical protein KDJ65_09695 [Anaerolineae bacterium]|nr:hypothetical protein [Anaerolineae bacterium]
MFYDILRILMLIVGTAAIYMLVVSTLQVPEAVAALPARVLNTLEAIGGLLIVGAWLVPPAESLTGALALIGLLFLITPTTARKLSQAYAELAEMR